MRHIVRQDDTLLEYGGRVLAGHNLCFGKGIACVGDPVMCNRHGLTVIAEGSTLSTLNGVPIALHGHRCACGCTLVSSSPDCRCAQ
ncbi:MULTISPECIES: PAAR domain-containing protein [Mangrovibacter]|uniref:PAAR domain-containing protein n=2 Tax=Mangrovibacter TaxID=451512 RepID=A0A1B7L7N6_9ENTR|nr:MULTISPECIES: PAAR domain-containing protein [Mangrovibacter]OAT78221.1 hypothetical protein A9B99_00310 [Mangrovibacter phragmitis]PWW10956.1 PAAR motif-containing protein [Mangrovibacter plantisponsor]